MLLLDGTNGTNAFVTSAIALWIFFQKEFPSKI